MSVRNPRIAVVFGTRPEAIKQAPIVLEARRRGNIDVIAVSTGQHRELLDSALAVFGVVPDVELSLMRAGQSPLAFVSRALMALDEEFAKLAPLDAVFVQGDTATAYAAAVAAFYRGIPVAHVEAGLRTDRLDAPFPEEAHRRMIGEVTRWHLAPTESSAANLRRDAAEATGATIHVTGNTVIDALYFAAERVKRNPPQDATLAAVLAWKRKGSVDPNGGDTGVPPVSQPQNTTSTSPPTDTSPAGRRCHPVILITGHRRENFGEPFRQFCLGLCDIARAHPDALLVYPVHLNPNVQAPVREILGAVPNVLLAPVADYPVFVALMQEATFLISDSGGVQEEAPALGKPVLVTRDVTERPEAVAAGGVLLVGPHRERLFAEADRLLRDPDHYATMARVRTPYGDGLAAGRCLDAVLKGL